MKERYLFIFRDGAIKTSTKFYDVAAHLCDIGALVCVDIGGVYPKEYVAGGWRIIERWKA